MLHSGPLTWQQRYQAALLYAGDAAQLTGPAVLALHRFTDAPAPAQVQKVHVLIPGTRARASTGYVRVQRTRSLPPHPVRLDGFPCAPLPRALADAHCRMPDEALRGCLYEAVQRGRYQAADLREAFRARRVAVTGELASVFADLAADTHSVAEGRARRLIAAAPDIPQPLWNPKLHLDGNFLCRPDAYWPVHGIILEVDSVRHHARGDDFARTLARHNRLAALGFCVLHVTPAQLRDIPAEFLAHLRGALARSPYGPVDRVRVT
ncbi:hypothetical protein [Streptomyces chilikensis]|uniref:DUF559 domain-containing protein n=1 Tax=Streptomyces chilikensis TaxID=1194079 RepID=A0ABV3EKS9_9ACTN